MLKHLGQKHFDAGQFGQQHLSPETPTGSVARLRHPRLAHLGQEYFDQHYFGAALSGATPPSGQVGDTFPLGWKSNFAKATFALGWVNRAVTPEPEPEPLPVGGMGIPIFRRGIDQAPHGDDDEVLMYVIRKFLERVDP